MEVKYWESLSKMENGILPLDFNHNLEHLENFSGNKKKVNG